MRIKSYLSWATLAAAYLVGCSIALSPIAARAGTLEIPAWSFARGNVKIYADPAEYADAGPYVTSASEKDRQPWGWSVEYDIDIPVRGIYRIQIQYAAARARPVEVYFDNVMLNKICTGVTFSKDQGELTWNSSGARWDNVTLPREVGEIPKGLHTVKITSRRAMPHLVALRLETSEAFPETWPTASIQG
jgi:hypothetical protein